MIVGRDANGIVLVRQVDHQAQCAAMAEAWGNAEFGRPEPYGPVIQAAAWHDEGWRGWELAPAVAGGQPVNFTGMDRRTHATTRHERHCRRCTLTRGALLQQPPP